MLPSKMTMTVKSRGSVGRAGSSATAPASVGRIAPLQAAKKDSGVTRHLPLRGAEGAVAAFLAAPQSSMADSLPVVAALSASGLDLGTRLGIAATASGIAGYLAYKVSLNMAPKDSYEGMRRDLAIANRMLAEAATKKSAMEDEVKEATRKRLELSKVIEELEARLRAQGTPIVELFKVRQTVAIDLQEGGQGQRQQPQQKQGRQLGSSTEEELRRELETANMLLAETAAVKSDWEARLMASEARAEELQALVDQMAAGGPAPTLGLLTAGAGLADEQLMRDLETASVMMAEAAAQKSDWEAQLMAAESRAAELQAIIDELQSGGAVSYSSAFTGSDDELRRDLEVANMLLADAAAKKSEMEAELMEAEVRAQELQSIIEDMEARGFQSSSSGSGIGTTGGDEELRRDLEVANMLLADAAAKKSEMEAELMAAEVRAQELQAMMEDMEARGGMGSSTSGMSSDVEELRRDLETANMLLAETAAKKSEMEAELVRAEAETQELRAIIEQMEAGGSFSYSSQGTSMMTGSDDELRRDLEVANMLLADAAAKKSEMEAELSEAEARAIDLQQMVETLEATSGRTEGVSPQVLPIGALDVRQELEIRSLIARLEDEVRKLNSDVLYMSNEVESVRAAVGAEDRLPVGLLSLETKLAAAIAAIKSLTTDLDIANAMLGKGSGLTASRASEKSRSGRVDVRTSLVLQNDRRLNHLDRVTRRVEEMAGAGWR